MTGTVVSILSSEDFTVHDWSSGDKYAGQMRRHKIVRGDDLWSRIAEEKRRDG